MATIEIRVEIQTQPNVNGDAGELAEQFSDAIEMLMVEKPAFAAWIYEIATVVEVTEE